MLIIRALACSSIVMFYLFTRLRPQMTLWMYHIDLPVCLVYTNLTVFSLEHLSHIDGNSIFDLLVWGRGNSNRGAWPSQGFTGVSIGTGITQRCSEAVQHVRSWPPADPVRLWWDEANVSLHKHPHLKSLNEKRILVPRPFQQHASAPSGSRWNRSMKSRAF